MKDNKINIINNNLVKNLERNQNSKYLVINYVKTKV